MAHSKHEHIRRLYNGCCGYCGVSETGSGGELTIDHYRPVSKQGDDSDDNLVYACNRCNLYKSDFFPAPTLDAPERRLLHPLLDDTRLHFREDDQGRLQALTVTGEFHIQKLRLNRSQLVELRFARQNAALRQEQIQRLERLLEDVNAGLSEVREMAARLTKDAGDI